MKKFLGITCILYSSIIIFIYISGNLGNYLAPTMQKYILISIPFLLLMGLVFILNKNINYKFKLSDLFLLLPLIMVLFAGNGRLTTTFASNRQTSFSKNNNTNTEEETTEKENINTGYLDYIEDDETDNNEQDIPEYDFSKVDFDIVDESYSLLSTGITYNRFKDKLVGKTIKVRGFTLLESEGIPTGYFGIGKYIISCCAADAGFGGFIAKYDLSKIKDNTWYEIEGVLVKSKDSYNQEILSINVINITEIDSKTEELYVYPCYAYGNNTCEVMDTYDIEL